MLTIVVIAALTLGVGGYVTWRWLHFRAPYGPTDLAASATLEMISYPTAVRILGPEVNAPLAEGDDQLVLGRVNWRIPAEPQPGGGFWIVLLDKRTRLKPAAFGVTSPRQTAVGIGGDSVLDAAVRRYSWLDGAGTRQIDDLWWSTGNAIYVDGADASPVTFVALFPAVGEPMSPKHAVATAPVSIPDLLVALICIGADRQVYWAQRLHG